MPFLAFDRRLLGKTQASTLVAPTPTSRPHPKVWAPGHDPAVAAPASAAPQVDMGKLGGPASTPTPPFSLDV